MNWTQLFTMQQKLDQYIQNNHGVKATDLFDKKILALLVELGELANETRCFKFWSHKKASEQQVILEEYVDGLHFILSIGIDQSYQREEIEASTVKVDAKETTEAFNDLFDSVIAFKQNSTEANYLALFQSFLFLGVKLGFSETDIQKAYLSKNEVNFTRQDSNY
ncbi:dimeric dUTPase (all-alpha-NTP-PPase superfamily) [Natronobacillus azotifigens]|uniref:dUTP diphosphatase n=1 Tax=Natronobacillus azotifigens TaxID=472978 RepID=A0A9J6RGD4_9BACI|nr:dUTP diphosphatase [Natronobacillus azotifigens]MCZ0704468.1 dUTP diphosphatase [Natronobacillus azotifigens]